MDAYDRAIEYATERGTRDGKNAAEWYAQDAFGGRVTRGNDESARRVLKGIEDGDPEVMDTFPSPDLSGEVADWLTGPQLVEDAINYAAAHTPDDNPPSNRDWFTDICDAYETAFAQAVEDEIARSARFQLGNDR